MGDDHVFELRDASVRLGGRTVLTGVDLRIGAGERVALIGPSGAGKTTLIRLLNGTVITADGSVRAFGCDYRTSSGRAARATRRRIGTVHQHFDLVPQLRVVHNVNAGRLGAWPLWKAVLSLVHPLEVQPARAALAAVGMADTLRERTADLSGGQQQRVAVARVLVQRPDAVLADEPASGLDRVTGRAVVDLLFRTADRTGTTLLASLHDLDTALSRFDRVIGLRAGRIVLDAASGEVGEAELSRLFGPEPGGGR